MTDLYDELWTQREAVKQAAARGGDILITGLGLGLVTEAIFRSAPAVNSVTVVEYSEDVISLVGPYLEKQFGKRLRIVHGSAFNWRTRRHYTVGWHDIWPDPYGGVVERQVARIEKRFSRWCDWQGSWPTAYLRDVNAA